MTSMRSYSLKYLKTRSTDYFKKIGKVTYKTNKLSEYITKKSYEALPKRLKKYVEEDKDKILKIVSNLSKISGEEGVDIYQSIKTYAEFKYNKTYSKQKKEIWELFKKVESSVYNHYNSYVYRLGYSASKYWFENVQFSNLDGSLVTTRLLLPPKAGGTIYNVLEIIYDYSSHYFEALMY